MSAERSAAGAGRSAASDQVAPVALAASFGSVPVGEWAPLPGTRVSRVFPSPPPPGGSAGVFAYSGAAFGDGEMCVAGGGHNDSSDNSVYCFSLATASWTRAWGPSASDAIPPSGKRCSPASRTYADGAPAARHTYHGLHRIGPRRLLLIGGSMWCGGGDAASDAWEIDLGPGKWTEVAAPGFSLPLGVKGDALADGTVYLNCDSSQCALWRQTPGGQWSRVGGPPAPRSNASAIDPKRRLLVYLTVVGKGVGISTQRLDGGALSARTLSGDPLPTGDTAQVGALDYEPTTDRMIVWTGGPEPHAVNLDSGAVTRLPGGGTPPGRPSDAGTFGRFRCLPGVCILARSANEDVFAYRVGPAGAAPTRP